MKTQGTKKLTTTADGYAIGVRCGKYHSGNHGLAEITRGSWQCQGCNQFYSTLELLNVRPGEIGCDRVIPA